MRIRSLLPLAALLAAAPAAAQPTQAYESEAGFAVEVPAAWRRMAEAELAESFLAAGAQGRMQDALDQTPAAQAGGRIAPPIWDAPNGVVWTRVALKAGEAAFSWSAGTLRPDGRAMIMCVYYGAEGEDEARVRQDLLAIIRSLRED